MCKRDDFLRRVGFTLLFWALFMGFAGLNSRAQVKEHIDWELKFGIVKFGEWFVDISEGETGLVYVETRAISTGVCRMLYRACYCFDAYMNPHTGLPIRSSRYITQRKLEVYNEVSFDHQKHPDSTAICSLLSGRKLVSKNIYDILTGFLCYRDSLTKCCFTKGKVCCIKTYFSDKEWDLNIDYLGLDTIKTVFGKIICHACRPTAEVGQFFDQEDAITFWFTADEYCVPIKAQIQLSIANVTAELVDYQNKGRSVFLK